MNFHERVSKLIQDIKAPKGQFNAFGKYKYRSCEDILEAVKPHLNGLVLTVSDDVVLIGDRFYIKSTASITDGENIISTVAFAREDFNKKGMDMSQVTGSTSSYSRKYALNGLLCIDDSKDADTQDNIKIKKRDYKKEKAMRDKIQTMIHGFTKELEPSETPQWIKDNLEIENFGVLNNMDENQLLVIGNKLKAMNEPAN